MRIQADQAALGELRKGFTGEIIVPGDLAYDEARTIFNAMINRRPGIIAQCAGVDDVVRAVHFGRNLGGDEGEERVVAGFGRGNYARLAKVKRQYDPENVFHLNHNIKPA